MHRFVGNFNMHYIIFIIFFIPKGTRRQNILIHVFPQFCVHTGTLNYSGLVSINSKYQNIKDFVHSICKNKELLWSGWYDSWIYDYLCNKCISPLGLRVWIPLRQGVLNTTLCDQVCLTCGRLVVFSRYSGFLHH